MAGYFILGNAALQPVPAGTPLSAFAPGSVVKISENESPVEFLVLQHGYSDHSDCTLLLRKNADVYKPWCNPYTQNYFERSLDQYLNETYFGLIDTNVSKYISDVTVHFMISKTVGGDYYQAKRKVFVLSCKELGSSVSMTDNPEESAISYFDSDAKRTIGKIWWARNITNVNNVYSVAANGVFTTNTLYSESAYVRPAFCLPGNIPVSEDGTITG